MLQSPFGGNRGQPPATQGVRQALDSTACEEATPDSGHMNTAFPSEPLQSERRLSQKSCLRDQHTGEPAKPRQTCTPDAHRWETASGAVSSHFIP